MCHSLTVFLFKFVQQLRGPLSRPLTRVHPLPVSVLLSFRALHPVTGPATFLLTADPLSRWPWSPTSVPPLQSRSVSQSESPFPVPRTPAVCSACPVQNQAYQPRRRLCLVHTFWTLRAVSHGMTLHATAKGFHFLKKPRRRSAPGLGLRTPPLPPRCCSAVVEAAQPPVTCPAKAGLKYELPPLCCIPTWKFLSGLRLTMYGSCKLLSPRDVTHHAPPAYGSIELRLNGLKSHPKGP